MMKKKPVKFASLVSTVLSENQSLQLNAKGKALLKRFYRLIQEIENSVIPVIEPFVKNTKSLKKEIAIHIISAINSKELGTEEFQIASRLDIMTSGGKHPIDGSKYPFNGNDALLKYVEPINR